MPNVTNTLVANITATEDTTQNVPINRGVGNPSYDSTSAEYSSFFPVTGAAVIGLPASPTTQVYVKNQDPAKAITVTWTPSTHVSAIVATLNPGDLIIFWANPAGATAPGVTALTLTNLGGGTALVEIFLGA